VSERHASGPTSLTFAATIGVAVTAARYSAR
jgi:hypothetical protein